MPLGGDFTLRHPSGPIRNLDELAIPHDASTKGGRRDARDARYSPLLRLRACLMWMK